MLSASSMMSQLDTHFKGAILFTSDCKASKMEGEAKSKNRRKLALVADGQQSKLLKPFQQSWHFYAQFPKGGKTRTKMDDLRQDSQTGLPTEYFALCSEHFEASCFSRSVLIGTPVDFKRFYLEKVSVPSIHAKMKDSLDIVYPRNEARLANRFFLEKTFFGHFFGTLPRNVSIQIPPAKKINFFSDWVGLFEICFQSSQMTD